MSLFGQNAPFWDPKCTLFRTRQNPDLGICHPCICTDLDYTVTHGSEMNTHGSEMNTPMVRHVHPAGQTCTPAGQKCQKTVRNARLCEKPSLKPVLTLRFGGPRVVTPFPGFLSRCHDVRMSGRHDVMTSGCQDVRMSGFMISDISDRL